MRSDKDWVRKHTEADRELQRLEEIRKKGEEYEEQKALLARKIDLITELKKQQAVPVHILDQISRNLPDFLWLDRMSALPATRASTSAARPRPTTRCRTSTTT